MATLGLGIIIYIVFQEWVAVTGGPSGLSGIPSLTLGPIVFDDDLKNYYLVWAFVLCFVLLSVNLANSRIGRAFRAIHDSEIAARVMGVNARMLKVQVFALSALICSVAGSLYAHLMTFVAPASFGFNISVELLTMVVIGGLGSIYGSFLGALLLTLLPEFLRFLNDYDIVFLRRPADGHDHLHARRPGAGNPGAVPQDQAIQGGEGGRPCLSLRG